MDIMSDPNILTPDDQRLAAARVRVAERLKEHRENLAGWSEGRYCPTCRGVGKWPNGMPCFECKGRQLVEPGYLVPTEPDPDEREMVRRELRACIAELEPLARILGVES